jgi:antitoxin (DNA-binding transcriptional repressor) of toxin-antitoxin stability system
VPALIDRVHAEGEPIIITKRGRTVARLVPAGDDELRLAPLSAAIAAETAALPAAFHRDPPDRLIVASCRVLDLPLLTRDARILRSRLVSRWTGQA